MTEIQHAGGDTASDNRDGAKRPRVLIVENEFLISHMSAETLAAAGADCDIASTAGEALARAGDGRSYAAAVVDLGLPDQPGEALIAALRADAPELPVVLASGRPRERLADLCAALGRAHYVAKPFGPEQLVDALRTAGCVIAANA